MHHPSFLHPQHLLLVPVLLLLLLLLSSATSTGGALGNGEFIFNSFSDESLTADGDASIVDGLLRLTSGRAYVKGHAFYPYLLNFTSFAAPNSSSVPSFSTTFVFAIIGQYYDLSGHGLAFVLSPTMGEFIDYSLLGQYLGLSNEWNNVSSSSHLLAIELDTIQNVEFADINSNHIGIDVNSLKSIASHTAGYYNSDDGKFHNLTLISRKPMQVWVDYDSKRTTLNVTIAPCCEPSSSSKPSRPLLSATCDLSSVLPNTLVYAGFSSATGTIKSKHYILGWSFKVNGEAAALNYSALSLNAIQELAQQAQVAESPRSYKRILCIVLLPTVAISVIVSAVLIMILIKTRLEATRNELEWQREYGPPSFSYKDLLSATKGFKDNMLLGRGGFGSVYKGVLPVSKQLAAIKRVSPESKQGMKEFIAEIAILGHLRHRNLVQLLGYCRHKQQLLLVYDYMPNGSLDCYLHAQDQNTTNLCWAQRFHIIKGVASGLFYLHEDWEQVVIHRDIKTSNVLLDNEMNARLGDFGLARSHAHGADAHTTHVAGTWGYIAPELAQLGKATKATDVFAFGVLMMEVACARRPIIWASGADGDPLALADWVLAAWRRGSITEAIDPRLDDYVEEETELVLKLGLLCSHRSPNARPRMRLVMQYLERDASLPADLQPDTLLSSIDWSQDEITHEQHDMSCPTTAITDLSRGR